MDVCALEHELKKTKKTLRERISTTRSVDDCTEVMPSNEGGGAAAIRTTSTGIGTTTVLLHRSPSVSAEPSDPAAAAAAAAGGRLNCCGSVTPKT